MKMIRLTAMILAAVMLLSACGMEAMVPTDAPAESTVPTQTECATEPMDTEPQVVPETEPSQEVTEATSPAETTESVPEATEVHTTTQTTTAKPTQTTTTTAKPSQSTGTSTGQTGTIIKPSASTDTQVSTGSKPSTSTSTGSGNASAEDFPSPTENSVLFFMETTYNCAIGTPVQADYVYNGSGKLTWFVSHPRAITVDQNGVFTSKSEGCTEVYVSDGTYTAKLEVFSNQYWWGAPHAFYFEDNRIQMTEGQAKLYPALDGSSFGNYRYTSSDKSVVTISGLGYITAVSPGTAVITASLYDAYARLIVTVVPDTSAVTLDITESTLSLYSKETAQLHYQYTGSKPLEWSSSNFYVASVDENGFITAHDSGTCSIYLSDGTYADECEVTVTIDPDVKATELNINRLNGPLYDGVTKYKGDYISFSVQAYPHNANQYDYIIVSDPKLISVSKTISNNDVIYRLDFKRAGTCVVTISSGDNEVKRSFTIHIQEDYAANPGSGQLTPEQFAACYNSILSANGMAVDYKPTGYLVLTLNPSQLTWEQARKSAEGLGHHWWSIGYRNMLITYEGTNEDGQHIFYERGC